jgi:hypothetical protein
VTIEVRPAPGGSGALLGVFRDGSAIGEAAVRHDLLVPRLAVAVDDAAFLIVADFEDVIHAVSRYMAAEGVVELDAGDLVIRYVARRAGFTGGLRAPLTAPIGGPPGRAADLEPVDAEGLAAAVNSLIGGPVAQAARASGAWARLAAVGVSGNVASVNLTIRAADGGSFTTVVPDRPDLMPEVVALAADTARAVRRAFPAELTLFRTIAFDRSQAGFSRGRRRLGGVAHQTLVETHLNAHYTYAEGILDARRHRVENPSKRPPFRPSGAATFVDGVVAHELWHLIEGVFERRHYRDSIEFRRRLGEFFGLPTLEHVLRPQRGDSGRGGAALKELREQVSAYATTNPREATAELFEAWWWGTPPLPPLVAHFGDVVQEFFPSARSAPRGIDGSGDV